MQSISKLMGMEWYSLLEETLHSPEMVSLGEKLVKAGEITPSWDNVFNAYKYTPPK